MTGEISPLMSLGEVHLTVSDLRESVAFYERPVGLEVLERGAGCATLGAGERRLLALTELPSARPAGRHTGLYHFALLVPERRDLAGWLAQAIRDRVPLVGLSDHFVSEALYLSDPDGHGIEIYWDRPREVWEGQVAERMTTLPLDADDLLRELEQGSPEVPAELPAGTTMGHIHLKVAAIPETVEFYRDVLGFALMAQFHAQAAFLGAAGYHHHVGANTWESSGASPPPEDTASLRHATIVLPDATERTRVVDAVLARGRQAKETASGLLVRDPSGNALVLATP